MSEMLRFLHSMFSFFLLASNTIFWCIPLLFLAIIKLLIPLKIWRFYCTIIINRIALNWTLVNNLNINITKKIKWEINGLEKLDPNKSYLLISNHQSGSDILALQMVFNRKIPFFRYFLKKELLWVPFLGLAWWALDYPFMKRYSKKEIEENPELKGKDLEITRKMCAKYKDMNVTIVNFLEGTRFTKEKHAKQKSIYKNLLMPRAGGIGYVFSAMGKKIDSIIDVTIVYPQRNYSFWDFLGGKVNHFVINIETIPVSDNLIGDYLNDDKFRKSFQKWVNDLWKKKDKLIDKIYKEVEKSNLK